MSVAFPALAQGEGDLCPCRGADHGCSDPAGRAVQETCPRLPCSQEGGGGCVTTTLVVGFTVCAHGSGKVLVGLALDFARPTQPAVPDMMQTL